MCTAVVVWALAASGDAAAHRGPPLRFGVLEDSGSSQMLLSLVVLSYLSEAQGAPVRMMRFRETGTLEEAFRKNEVDLLLLAPDEKWAKASCAAGTIAPEAASARTEEYFNTRFPGVWLKLFTFPLGDSLCSRPGVLVHSKVHGQLRFSLLLRSLEKVVGAVELEDVQWLKKEAGADGRERAAVVRKVLSRKGLW